MTEAPEKKVEEIAMGKATLVIEVNGEEWHALAKLIDDVCKAAHGYVVEVHIGSEKWDA